MFFQETLRCMTWRRIRLSLMQLHSLVPTRLYANSRCSFSQQSRILTHDRSRYCLSWLGDIGRSQLCYDFDNLVICDGLPPCQ